MSEESQNEGQEKSFDASESKIKKSREKGDTPQSTETHTLFIYIGFAISILLAGSVGVRQVFSGLNQLLVRPELYGSAMLQGQDSEAISTLAVIVITGALPVFCIPFLCVVISLILQRSIVFAPSKLVFKLSRLSPISNAKQKYGPNGMMEFLKRLAKLSFIMVIAGIFFSLSVYDMVGKSRLHETFFMPEIKSVTLKLTFYMIMATGIVVLIDLPYSRFSHLKKLRMTFQEVRDETKDSEGDPHMKSARRARAHAISQSSMMKDVASADVIIVNPTHYAVALKWSRTPGSVPICVAKGVDQIALQIRLKAKQHDVPIHSDPPSARALHASVNIGEGIHPEHFAAVAAAIHFADKLKPKSY